MILPNNGSIKNHHVAIELGNPIAYQPYDVKNDMGEQNNLVESNGKKIGRNGSFIRKKTWKRLQKDSKTGIEIDVSGCCP